MIINIKGGSRNFAHREAPTSGYVYNGLEVVGIATVLDNDRIYVEMMKKQFRITGDAILFGVDKIYLFKGEGVIQGKFGYVLEKETKKGIAENIRVEIEPTSQANKFNIVFKMPDHKGNLHVNF